LQINAVPKGGKPYALAVSSTARWLSRPHDDCSGISHGPIEETGAGSLIQVHISISGCFDDHKTLRDRGLNHMEDRSKPFDRPKGWPKGRIGVQTTYHSLLLQQDHISSRTLIHG
jgi:hypothetical protein